MRLQEMLEKSELELAKLEEKEEKIARRKKQLGEKIKNIKTQIEAEKNKEVAEIISKNIGELSEEKIKILSQVLAESAEKFNIKTDEADVKNDLESAFIEPDFAEQREGGWNGNIQN